ncbi:MAG: AraC family transcriptional regulator [Sedimentisphaeraceae bacterium JB056]
MSITDTVIVPDSCRENVVNLATTANAVLRENMILAAGISELYPPYHIVRLNPKHSFFAYIIDGSGELKTDNQTYLLKGGDMLVLPAGSLQDYRALDYFKKVWFHIDDTPKWSFLKDEGSRVFESRFGEEIHHALSGFLNEVFAASVNVSAVSLANAYAEIICELIRRVLHPQARGWASKRLRQLNEIWREVNEKLYVPWQVEDLAERMEISAVQFHRLHVKYFSCTPISFLTDLRMNKARHILRTTDLNLQEVAVMVGYDSAFSFSRAFKKHNDISPSKFRSQS